MPASRAALARTDSYRDRLARLRLQAESTIERTWGLIDLDDTEATYREFVRVAAATVETSQRVAGGLTEGYLAEYISAELGRPAGVGVDTDAEAGTDQFDRPLARALRPPLLTVRALLHRGSDFALTAGRHRAMRIGGEAIAEAARATLADAMQTDPRIDGWRRAVAGTCGACLSAATGAVLDPGEPLERHPNCQCVGEPRVVGVLERVFRATGEERVAAMSVDEMRDQFGEEKAALLLSGEISLSDLEHRQELALGGTVITETPLTALT